MRRRDVLAGALGAAAWATGWWPPARARGTGGPRLRFAYAAITWDGNDAQAIDDIAAVGFRGIQLRTSAVAEWDGRPDALKALLASRGLIFVALSSGVMPFDPTAAEDAVARHVTHARFARDAGCLYLQIIDERPAGRDPTPEDYRRMGRLLTELGRRTADLGVTLGYHHHMGALGESPDEVARVLDAADPQYVKLVLDTAHYRQGGGVPADAVDAYAGRLLFLHLKDVESPVPGGDGASYRFVELGRGAVGFPAVFDALERTGFEGWGVVELDRVPDPARTPKESAMTSRRYLEDLGFTI